LLISHLCDIVIFVSTLKQTSFYYFLGRKNLPLLCCGIQDKVILFVVFQKELFILNLKRKLVIWLLKPASRSGLQFSPDNSRVLRILGLVIC